MKKFIGAVIAAAVVSVSAAAYADYTEWNDNDIMPLLDSLGIMEGDGNGNYNLDAYVTREEMAKIAVNSSAFKDETAVGLKVSPFSDVDSSSWAAPYILNGTRNGIFSGYLDGTFQPEGMVTYEEAVTMMLRVLGYTDSYFGISYPYGQISTAKNIDLLDNVNSDFECWLTRRQVARLIYNALNTEIKGTVTKYEQSSASSSTGTSTSSMGATGNTVNSETSRDSASVSTSTNTGMVAGQKLITIFDADFVEDAVLISRPENGSEGKVLTSSGKYNVYNGFNYDYIGMQGDMVIKNKKDMLCFVPNNSVMDKYVVYSMLNNSIIGYHNGTMSQIDVKDTTTCYKDSQVSTYAAVKSSMEMGDVVKVKYDSSGNVDYVIYEKGSMEGPIKVTGSDMVSNYIKNSSTQVMRDGNKTTSSEIQMNDVIYYSSELNMVLAYSTKVTGIYESASPSRDQPNIITISGKEYTVEGVQAFNDLSSSGPFRYGDTITVVLGKSGDVAGVVTSQTSASTTQYGYVVSYGKKNFNNNDGTTYSSNYISIVGTDGITYEYATESDCSSYVCGVVKVSFENGKTKVTRVSSSGGISGRVDADNMKIGSYKLAQNCRILDTLGSQTSDTPLYKAIYAQRLDGVEIQSSKVRYCVKNAQNEITDLILINMTGDFYSYGVVTGGSDKTYYNVDVDGTSYQMVRSSGAYVFEPCKVYMSGSGLKYSSALKSRGSITKLTQSTATINNIEYKLSDKVTVYERTIDSKFNKISINDAINGNYSLTAYYDKAEDEGGRIRVIIAEAK